MAKKRRRMALPDPETPLSSMIDVVFLLLIYFISTQKEVIEDSYLSVDMPSGSAPSNNTPNPNLLKIDVMKLRENSDDYYHVNGLKYHVNDLREYLRSVGDTDKNTTVIINCGPNAKHRKLIVLLDMCNEMGLTKINLINDSTVRFVPDH